MIKACVVRKFKWLYVLLISDLTPVPVVEMSSLFLHSFS